MTRFQKHSINILMGFSIFRCGDEKIYRANDNVFGNGKRTYTTAKSAVINYVHSCVHEWARETNGSWDKSVYHLNFSDENKPMVAELIKFLEEQ